MFITSLITWNQNLDVSCHFQYYTLHCVSEARRKLIAKKEKAEKDKAAEGYSISLKEWRRAFRGHCRAPWLIPKKGGKYEMCPE